MDRRPSTPGSGNDETYLPCDFFTSGDPQNQFHDDPTNCWWRSRRNSIDPAANYHRTPPLATDDSPLDGSALFPFRTPPFNTPRIKSASPPSTPGSFTRVGIGSVPAENDYQWHGDPYSPSDKVSELDAHGAAAWERVTDNHAEAIALHRRYLASSDSFQRQLARNAKLAEHLSGIMEQALKEGTSPEHMAEKVQPGLGKLRRELKIGGHRLGFLQEDVRGLVTKYEEVGKINTNLCNQWRRAAHSVSETGRHSTASSGPVRAMEGDSGFPPPSAGEGSGSYDETSRQ
ncbi:hypothetical protein L204_103241 [Cryptococcus depauperatus]|nr:hypothetical protein L204_00008 [Cryptococcus depauperatus CBS 7855]